MLPPAPGSVMQPPTMPSSPNRSRNRTVSTSHPAEPIIARIAAWVTSWPAELNWCVRTDSSCSLGTSASLAGATAISVRQYRRKSSLDPPNSRSACCRRRRSRYSSLRRRPSSVTTSGLNAGQPSASAMSSGDSTSTSGSAKETSARSYGSSSTKASASGPMLSSARMRASAADFLSQPHSTATNVPPVTRAAYSAAAGGFLLAIACTMPRLPSSASAAAAAESEGGCRSPDSMKVPAISVLSMSQATHLIVAWPAWLAAGVMACPGRRPAGAAFPS